VSLELLASPVLRGGALIAAGVSENRLAKAAAQRVRLIGEDDARLRTLQGAQLLAEQRVARVKQGVSGPTVTDVAVTTADLEAADVERFRFAAAAQADQTERQGRAALFGNLMGLSTVFLDAVEAKKAREANEDLRRLIGRSQSRTAISTGLPVSAVGIDMNSGDRFRGFA